MTYANLLQFETSIYSLFHNIEEFFWHQRRETMFPCSGSLYCCWPKLEHYQYSLVPASGFYMLLDIQVF